jgi:hypothetical protein
MRGSGPVLANITEHWHNLTDMVTRSAGIHQVVKHDSEMTAASSGRRLQEHTVAHLGKLLRSTNHPPPARVESIGVSIKGQGACHGLLSPLTKYTTLSPCQK